MAMKDLVLPDHPPYLVSTTGITEEPIWIITGETQVKETPSRTRSGTCDTGRLLRNRTIEE